MVKDLWNNDAFLKISSPLEQRVYSSHLLGRDPELVAYGGGNTSLKDEIENVFGEKEKILFIKGSGWDLATIEKEGFPGIRLEHLLRLRSLPSLSDEMMVNELRTHLIDCRSPDPSVEALLHAFLPHRFIDHTHSEAVLSLTNQPHGEALVRDLYGTRVAIVPYVMPGFTLAKLCADIFDHDPMVEGLILLRHGIFTFGDTARESYDRMIKLVRTAEEFIRTKPKSDVLSQVSALPEGDQTYWVQVIRSQFLKRSFPCVALLDESEAIRSFLNHPEIEKISQKGPLTPDHVTRTKRLPLLLTKSIVETRNMAEFNEALDRYTVEYETYFERNCRERRIAPQRLDPWPRVLLLPEVGSIAVGSTYRDAKIASDIYHRTASAILNAHGMNGYEALSEDHIFDVEYWPLQQAKIKQSSNTLPLTGKVAVVTGGASGIGLAIAKKFAEQGAVVNVFDLNHSVFESLGRDLSSMCRSGNTAAFLKVDVTHREQVRKAIEKVVKAFGGVDILVVNAGIFPSSELIEDISDATWEKSLSINLSGAFYCTAEALRWMKLQGVGGDIVFIASKNVPAPGPKAGAYSVAKAGQAQLARVCALEGGAHGIRVNMLHPHLVLDTGIWSDEVIEKRAKAYGMTPKEYRQNNLLKTELSGRDVAESAFALVAGYFSKTTGAQIPVDGGSDRTL